jgi:hypothetical protein
MASSMKKSGPRVNNCRNFSAPNSEGDEPPVNAQVAVKADPVNAQVAVKADPVDAQVAVKADPVNAQVAVKADPVDAQVKAVAGVVLTAKECAPLC